uniref:Nuclear transport factor 2 family protein n=1 Tax=Caenorhabditis tropicalis TaxID=1561998 RepID=A0A1I7URM6_9PELO
MGNSGTGNYSEPSFLDAESHQRQQHQSSPPTDSIRTRYVQDSETVTHSTLPDFVSFLKNHKVSDVLLEKEETMPNGEIRGIAKIWAASPHQEPKTSSWIFVLSPSASSPTGLVFTKIMLCDAGCVMI